MTILFYPLLIGLSWKLFFKYFNVHFSAAEEHRGDWGSNRGRGGTSTFTGRPRPDRRSFSEDLPNPAPGKVYKRVFM